MTAAQENVPMPRPQRPATLTFTQAILGLQAFAAIFAILLLWGLGRAGEVAAPAWLVWGCGLPFVLALGYAAGQQRKGWGRWLGWALQAPMLAAGLVEPAIALIGVIFLGLWIMALRLGGRIDRERAERDAAASPGAGESGAEVA
ncbi:DUF4233 domain-containing protein [Demequina lignilytica]|uniref:DUF4233 domain-containing protein n=1 Tax=Demequina lignilytica TaxID=3051663 RepID=A0AB35MIZ0_9MICO|nr:DUF4233 domain-containing protein [Demequina sp. SYSU T0a273]MDN4483759.1 DUF4233 domain-containing protein [Demequina sp. SYSU T0a273]